MNKSHRVLLTDGDRAELRQLLAAGTAPARKLTHARILLKADQSPGGPGWTDQVIAAALETSEPTIARVRQQFATDGLAAALTRRPSRRVYTRKLDGAQEAHLIAVTCSAPPAGRSRWVLRLLAAKLVELEVVERISYQTVRRVLKKTN